MMKAGFSIGWLTWVVALAASAAPGMAPADIDRSPDVEAFDRIYFSGAATLRLRQGDAVSVHVDGDPAAVKALSVEVSDGVLYLETDHKAADAELEIDVTLTELRELVTAGASRSSLRRSMSAIS